MFSESSGDFTCFENALGIEHFAEPIDDKFIQLDRCGRQRIALERDKTEIALKHRIYDR